MTPEVKISQVLVGVEFDDASASALKMAGALAAAWDADITVFHAATQDVLAYFTAAQIDVLGAEREQGRAGTAEARWFGRRISINVHPTASRTRL